MVIIILGNEMKPNIIFFRFPCHPLCFPMYAPTSVVNTQPLALIANQFHSSVKKNHANDIWQQMKHESFMPHKFNTLTNPTNTIGKYLNINHSVIIIA